MVARRAEPRGGVVEVRQGLAVDLDDQVLEPIDQRPIAVFGAEQRPLAHHDRAHHAVHGIAEPVDLGPSERP